MSHREKYEQQIYAAALARKTEVDMALIKLKSPVRVTALVKPALLPRSSERNQMYANRMAIVSGMGVENAQTSSVSYNLKYTELKIMAQADCRPYFGDVDVRRLCAKSSSSFAATCPGLKVFKIKLIRFYDEPFLGDSGSPLIIKDLNDVVVVGIVSFGTAYGCDIGELSRKSFQ